MNKTTGLAIRPFEAKDLKRIVTVYRAAFAEPPWNEFKKCSSCGISYGICESERPPIECKSCNAELKLVDFWKSADVIKDLRFALSQPNPIVLVAEDSRGIVGFTWGYKLPKEEFPFLEGSVKQPTIYMDEIAVQMRREGIGSRLCVAFLREALNYGAADVVLRTDKRNSASMGLFRSEGFVSVETTPMNGAVPKIVYDPKYPERLYLKRTLR